MSDPGAVALVLSPLLLILLVAPFLHMHDESGKADHSIGCLLLVTALIFEVMALLIVLAELL